MPAATPGLQAAGDSQVTFSVPVLSPPILYTGRNDPTRLDEEAAMNNKIGDTWCLRRAGVLAVMAGVAVLATACGVRSVTVSASGGSATFAQVVALAQCMRSHGVPNFPDPSASGGFTLSANGAKGTVDIDSSQVRTAYGACRHLLSGGGPNLAQLQQHIQQQEQQAQRALPELLKFYHCMRSYGVPNFPDPPAIGQGSAASANSAGIDPTSPQFQAAVRACHYVLPAGVHLRMHTSAGVNKS
jgi:hypothetical protein